MPDHEEDPAQAADPATDDERLQQAMEHKKQQSWTGVGGASHKDTGKGKGDSHRAGGSRQFRRKSG